MTASLLVHLGPREIGASLLVGAGAALAVVGLMMRAQRRTRSLAEILDLAWGERDVPVVSVTETPAVRMLGVRLEELAGQLDRRGSLRASLDRARLPFRPGEYLVMTGAAMRAAGVVLAAVASAPLVGVIAAAAVGIGARALPGIRAARRGRRLEAQLPGAFSVIASSMTSGHTFLRSIQMLRGQVPSPLSEELDRVVAETMLGQELIDALDHMADRYDIMDLRWVVHAVRTQQLTGGKVSDILHTMADFMRTREEVRREVQVLTAEGRVSAYVLIALPVLLGLALQVIDPAYLRPFFRGPGLVVLGGCAAMLAIGYVIIRRMADIKV